ncbi:MAG: Gfo/Idh/MocA family oxidoreductase [Proteobacteria bacterium]|nr:Gfo/Idh/MocA family oxidoreductase [Pseudomonadota bacterium]
MSPQSPTPAASPAPAVALIGCGRWGRNIARALAGLGALKVVADPAQDLAGPIARDLGVDAVADTAAVLARSDIDAVAIAAPAARHAALVRAALAAGKHVFVEKPLALTLADAEACAEAARASGLTLMVGHLLQYHPAFRRLVEVVEEGAIGAVRHVSSHRLNPGAIRTEETALFSLAPHDVSMVLRLCGRQPDRISAMSATISGAGLADAYWANLAFGDAVTAHIQVSWLSPFKEHKLTVLGDAGALVFEDTAPAERKLVLYRDPIDRSGAAPAYRKSDGERLAFDAAEPLKAEMSAFLDAVRGGRAPATGPDEAIPVLAVLRGIEDAAAARPSAAPAREAA